MPSHSASRPLFCAAQAAAVSPPSGLVARPGAVGAALACRLAPSGRPLAPRLEPPHRAGRHPAGQPGRRSISNSMGLPNQGLRVAVEYLRRAPKSPPVIASVAGFSGSELVDCALAVEPHAAAVEIGLVCPNTTDTERLEELRIFHALVEELSRRKSKPVFIKLPPHHDGVQRHHVVAMVDACLQAGIDGLSLSGTRSVSEPRLAMGKGSLAGRPVFLDTLRIVGDLAERAGGRLAIKAAGGVFTGGDARQMLDAGADAVEVYSSFIYRGWDVARRIAAELAELGSLPQRSPNRLGRDRDAVQSGTVGR